MIVGDRAVHGWNPQGVADLVGVTYEGGEKLTCAQLAARLDAFAAAAQRAVRQIPEAHLAFKWPGRDRTMLQLGYHIFRIALTYRDTREQGILQEYWFGENPPSDLQSAAAVADFGERARRQMAEWLQGEGVFEGMCETYYGPQTAPELFERTVWHMAQHLRQIYVMLESVGVTPEAPLTEADYAGLPLPDSIW